MLLLNIVIGKNNIGLKDNKEAQWNKDLIRLLYWALKLNAGDLLRLGAQMRRIDAP